MSTSRNRNRSNNNSNRTRKISLQHDYAYCIISPVSPSVIPIQEYRTQAFRHSYQNLEEIDVGEEAYTTLEEKCATGENGGIIGLTAGTTNFHRWSFCNFQTSVAPTAPAMTEETAIQFANAYDEYRFKLIVDKPDDKPSSSSSSSSNSGSSTSLTKFTDVISQLPDRIRKISSENKKFNAQTMQKDHDIREQMKKLVVF